jgi:hypothetical protein
MFGFRKSLIACVVVVLTFVLSPIKTSAYEVSACGGCSVPDSHPDAWRFYDKVRSYPGWTGRFYKKYSNCKEIYYKRMADGGQNNSWVDSSDIHYHISHGGNRWDPYYEKWLRAVLFQDGSYLVPSEARLAWGDTDLEWIAFRNCKLLNNASKGYWANAMNRLHLLLGFKTNSSKHDNFGKIWAQKMRQTTINFLWWPLTIPGQTVTQAWFYATDVTQPSGRTARVLAEELNNYNDHLWGNGYTSPDPTVDSWYWWWDHTSGSPEYLSVNSLKTMNVYEVVPRNVDEQYVKDIGAAFTMTGEVGEDYDSFVMVNLDVDDPNYPQVLQVSKDTGKYYYQDYSKLFYADPTGGRYNPDRAGQRADEFLRTNDLLPLDAGAYTVESDTIVEENRDDGSTRKVLNQNTNTVYGRQIEGAPEQLVSVAGPGARLKVYIYEDGQIMGGMGNWRQIKKTGEIPVMINDDAWFLFQKYGQDIAIAPVYVEYDKVKIIDIPTQAYYEYSGLEPQKELIPCWIFEVEYYLGDQLVTTADTFVPAAESYCPPLTRITSPADGSAFKHGQTIAFDCSTMADFGTPPLRYTWESDVDGLLSTAKSFTSNSLSINCPDSSCDCSPLPHTISVTVTDAKGLQSTDSIQITVEGPCDECANCADLDRNNMVDMKDLAIWANRYLTQSGYGE